MRFIPFHTLALALGVFATAATTAAADMLQFTVTNNQPAGGFAFSPVWLGIHDGTFTTFTPGGTASSALQSVAELADTSKITTAFAGQGAQATLGSAPYGPGSSASTIVDVANPSTDRYLSFASMVVPSNDFFFGNANPLAFPLFDASGRFLGPKTIQIFGKNVWDAGTEVNNINFGAAFIVGDNITDHVAANGTIQLVFGGPNDLTSYLGSINGKATPYGYDISHLISPNDLIATISVVPEPSAFVISATGIAGLCWAAARRKRAAASA